MGEGEFVIRPVDRYRRKLDYDAAVSPPSEKGSCSVKLVGEKLPGGSKIVTHVANCKWLEIAGDATSFRALTTSGKHIVVVDIAPAVLHALETSGKRTRRTISAVRSVLVG